VKIEVRNQFDDIRVEFCECDQFYLLRIEQFSRYKYEVDSCWYGHIVISEDPDVVALDDTKNMIIDLIDFPRNWTGRQDDKETSIFIYLKEDLVPKKEQKIMGETWRKFFEKD